MQVPKTAVLEFDLRLLAEDDSGPASIIEDYIAEA